MNEKKQLLEDVKEVVKQVVNPLEEKLTNLEKNNNEIKQNVENTERKYASIFLAKSAKDNNKQEMEKGIAFSRIVKLAYKCKNDPEYMASEAKKQYEEDCPGFVKELTQKNNSTIPSEGGFLVPEKYSNEIIELLRPMVFLYSAGAKRQPMPTGNLNLPVYSEGSLSYFVGEGGNAIPTKHKFSNIKLNAKKQVSMALLTDELLKNNSYSADMAIRNDILREMAVTLNYVALYGSGTEFTPQGILNTPGINTRNVGAAPSNTLAPEIKGTIMKTNVAKTNLGFVMNGALWASFYNLTDANGNFIHRAEMDKNKLVGDNFYLYNQIPIGTDIYGKTDIFYGDWAEFVIGEQDMFTIDVSKDASIKINDTQTLNLWQQGYSAIKVTSWYDFALRHAEAFTVYREVRSK